MSDQIVHTTDADFAADVLQSEQPVLLDFWAEWCGPCRMIAPILDSIAAEQEGRLRIVKLNIDENPRTPMQFNVRSIPMLLLFSGGSVVDQVVGAVPKARLEAFLKPHLDGKGSDS